MTLREFGLTIGAVLVILGCVALWRGKGVYPYLLATGILSALLGQRAPAVLKPVQKAWMAFAVVLGFFMSRVVLTMLFYAVITPIGLITKILGKDILNERIEKSRASYWIERKEIKAPASYENQY